jgi:hypothetical protein
MASMSGPLWMVAILWIEKSTCSMLTVDGMAAMKSCMFLCDSTYSWLVVARSVSWVSASAWEFTSIIWGCVGGNASSYICPSSISVSLV